MKLYYSKGACSLAVRILINELDIVCDYQAVTLKTHLTETGVDFYSINPKGAVPALELNDGSILTENNVIQQYLADTHSNSTHLLPRSGIERYRVLSWMNYMSVDLHKSCSPLFNSAISDELKEQIFKPILVKKLEYVDSQLAKNDYINGSSFSLADAYLFVVLRWLPALKVNRQEFTHIEAFFQKVHKRPSVIKSLEQEQIS
ncbi:MAG: glutathione transferase GstA [Gammaproteobacteria bacterium]|nr:glutathione transferase GstA [Gammaproteobacteria bacterium]